MSVEPTRPLFERACRQRSRGHLRAALATYDGILAQATDPQDAEAAHWGAGEILMAMRDHPGAERHFRAAIAIDPDEPAYRQVLGRCLIAAGRPARAATELAEAAARAPGLAETHRLWGWALFEAGDARRGRTELARAVFLDKSNLRARVDLAVCLATLGDVEGGLALARSAQRLDPSSRSIRDAVDVLEGLCRGRRDRRARAAGES